MASLEKEAVEHLARLARFKFSQEEVLDIRSDLEQILGYVDELQDWTQPMSCLPHTVSNSLVSFAKIYAEKGSDAIEHWNRHRRISVRVLVSLR